MTSQPRPEPSASAPHLRLVESSRTAQAPLGAYTLFVVALSASAGHGLFLVAALTRLRSLPSRAELGGLFETSVLAWFAASLPLLALALARRRRFLALAPSAAGRLAGATALVTLLAFAAYLRAVAL